MSALDYFFKYKKSLLLLDGLNNSKYRKKFLDGNDHMFYYFAHMSTLGSIVSINISIFMFWIYGKRYNWRTEMFMLENFSLSVEHLKHGKFYTIITSGFSHSKLWHISLNMTAFWGISIPLIQSFGHNNYLSYYFGASALVSMVTIFRELYSKRKKNLDRSQLN